MPVKRLSLKRRSIKVDTSVPPTKISRKTKSLISNPVPHRVLDKGIVLTFGQGDVGQLGLGPDIMEKAKPASVPELSNIVDVCAGGMHTVILNSHGEVYTFGCNDEGALGRVTTDEGSETIPGKVELPGKVNQITAGDSHSAVLLEDGRVFAWGSFRDSSGNMGLTMNGIEKLPVEMLPAVQTIKIASGADHLVMLSNDGHLYTCGCGEQGQLGRVPERGASRACRQGVCHLLLPTAVTFKPRLKPEFENVWAGSYCTYAKETTEGRIYVFGLNNYNQLGIENTRPQFFPVVAESFSGTTWVHISGGQHHSIALDNKGNIYALGRKEYGRLGLGEVEEDAKKPTLIPALKDKKCIDVACGSAVSFAVTDSGEVFAWGMGTNGQLGTGEEDDLYEPTLIRGKQLEGKKVLQVSAGGQHTVLLAK